MSDLTDGAEKFLYDTTERGKRIENFSDESMFVAEEASGTEPRVTIVFGPSDPLGQLAQLGKGYQGIFIRRLEEISDTDRQYYITDEEKNILGTPSEFPMFHFLIENVTRSFTHQLVRTRHASYVQESMRFAVKEDFPVGLPPSLRGGYDELKEIKEDIGKRYPWWENNPSIMSFYLMSEEEQREVIHQMQVGRREWNFRAARVSQQNTWYSQWMRWQHKTAEYYQQFVDSGMPAEDARGITPSNMLTKINVGIQLNSLMSMAGKRLCTQAQWEWKQVFAGIIRALEEYGETLTYRTQELPRAGAVYSESGDNAGNLAYEVSSSWQYQVLADRFRPVCYQMGRCQFRSDFDRYCNIRDRVEAFAAQGIPSSQWHLPHVTADNFRPEETSVNLGIPRIDPKEWLAPDAAIRKDGSWRSEQAQANIRDRRR